MSEQFVHLELTRAILAHESAQRSALVGRVVIDVERGIALPACERPVDELFERALLLDLVVRPPVTKHWRARVHRDDAEQVFETIGGPGEAFDVEEDVVSRRSRQHREPAACAVGIGGAILPRNRACNATRHLHLGLHVKLVERRAGHPWDVNAVALGKRCDCIDASITQADDLATRDAGDETQVIHVGQYLLRGGSPAAVCAVECRVGALAGVPVPLE